MLPHEIIASLGLFLAGIGLIYTGRQIQQARKIARGEFLLHLDELFAQHNDVHLLLRPGGDYANGGKKPDTTQEWTAVERYMGLFERVKALIDDKIIDIDTVYSFYGYRVFNLTANETIRECKLVQEEESWIDFVELWRALEAYRKRAVAKKVCI